MRRIFIFCSFFSSDTDNDNFQSKCFPSVTVLYFLASTRQTPSQRWRGSCWTGAGTPRGRCCPAWCSRTGSISGWSPHSGQGAPRTSRGFHCPPAFLVRLFGLWCKRRRFLSKGRLECQCSVQIPASNHLKIRKICFLPFWDISGPDKVGDEAEQGSSHWD